MPPSLATASSGTYITFARESVSMLFAVVIPGRSVVSGLSMATFTSNTFASAFGRCSPTFATAVTFPDSRFDGSASSVTLTGWPTASLRTSISFTYVIDSSCVRSGSVATAGSHGLMLEPTARFLPFHSLM